MLHKREGRHAEKAHKVGIFIDMIHVAEGLNPYLKKDSGQAGMTMMQSFHLFI
jgi:hypothetical protein